LDKMELINKTITSYAVASSAYISFNFKKNWLINLSLRMGYTYTLVMDFNVIN